MKLDEHPGLWMTTTHRALPGVVIERNKRRSRHGNINGPDLLPDLVGSNVTDDVYLITQSDNEIGWRKWLVAPYCFLYIAGYITSSATFGLFVYYKVQRDLYPDLDQLNETSACKDVNKSSLDYQRQVHVQDVASNWGIYTSLAVGIPAIFANMLLGSSTDKFGRKFLFFLPCIGTLIRMIVTVNGIYFDFNLTYHLIGFIVEGLTGQLFTMLLVCFTYVADVTSQKGKQEP
ncbi:hypothetical protein DPMN_059911 [Dreissena polymorpha]|uniref:Uncharacterized protein n=1 Tax=Dreissena polymorpha TaxID=45954 RepID=A0A9D4C496_DREPO|nr:hypothetical protein DPMN_059911 [Dreissena polymorpha]